MFLNASDISFTSFVLEEVNEVLQEGGPNWVIPRSIDFITHDHDTKLLGEDGEVQQQTGGPNPV